MEKKIGEKINLEDAILIVEERGDKNCKCCYFYEKCKEFLFYEVTDIAGSCGSVVRGDKKDVIFIKIDK